MNGRNLQREAECDHGTLYSGEYAFIKSQQPHNPPKSPFKVSLDTDLELPLNDDGRTELLSSSVDYTVWHDDQSMGTSLIVLDAKCTENEPQICRVSRVSRNDEPYP